MKTLIAMSAIFLVPLFFVGCLEIEEQYDDCRSEGCSGDFKCLFCSNLDEWMCLDDVGMCPEPADCRSWGCEEGTECLDCRDGGWMCLEDIGLCPDSLECPDPDDPLVHYASEDIEICHMMDLFCSDDQRSFYNECGCGCIDNGPSDTDCRTSGCNDGFECLHCENLDDWVCLTDAEFCDPGALPDCDAHSYVDCPEGCIATCESSCDACDDCNGPGGCTYPYLPDCRTWGCEEGAECLQCSEVGEWMCLEDMGLCPEEVPPLLEPGFEDTLSNVDGCADVYIYAINEADTLALLFRYSEVVQEAHELGTAQTHIIDLSTDGELLLRVGEQFFNYACLDYTLPGSETVVEAEYAATDGTATLVVTPNMTFECLSYHCPATAALTLENVVLRDSETSDELTIEHLELLAPVGWAPG